MINFPAMLGQAVELRPPEAKTGSPGRPEAGLGGAEWGTQSLLFLGLCEK